MHLRSLRVLGARLAVHGMCRWFHDLLTTDTAYVGLVTLVQWFQLHMFVQFVLIPIAPGNEAPPAVTGQ